MIGGGETHIGKPYKITGISFLAILVSITVLFFSPKQTFSQKVTGGLNNSATTSSFQKNPDKAGQAVWNKLQDKQVSCKNLKDDDFDKLGNFFMGSMMGSSDDYIDQLMTQRLGQDGEKQMHIVMGKRLSGCDTNAAFPQGAEYFMPMMGGFGGMMNGWNANNQSLGNDWPSMMGNSGWSNMMNGSFGYWSILGLLTWALAAVFLLSGTIYFWREINKNRVKKVKSPGYKL